MKKTIYLAIAGFVIVILVISCKTDDGKQQIFPIKVMCKNLIITDSATEIPDTLSCIDYLLDTSLNKLSLRHINAGFNCCPDTLYWNVIISNDTITIQEFEEFALCDCNCLYDLDIELMGVYAKEYIIKFVEPYCGEQENIIFGVDLKIYQEGSYCVTRHQYPWGVQYNK